MTVEISKNNMMSNRAGQSDFRLLELSPPSSAPQGHTTQSQEGRSRHSEYQEILRQAKELNQDVYELKLPRNRTVVVVDQGKELSKQKRFAVSEYLIGKLELQSYQVTTKRAGNETVWIFKMGGSEDFSINLGPSGALTVTSPQTASGGVAPSIKKLLPNE